MVSVEPQRWNSQSASETLTAFPPQEASQGSAPLIHPFLPLRLGMKLALADVDEEGLRQTENDVSLIIGASNVLADLVDVADLKEVVRFKEKVFEAWDEVCPQICLL